MRHPPTWIAALIVLTGCAKPTISTSWIEQNTGPTPAVSAVVANDGPVRQRVPASDGAELVLWYGGEQRGSMDTCGCQVNPRGSLARIGGYTRAHERVHRDTRTALLNPGHWLSDRVGIDGHFPHSVRANNDLMLEALQQGEWDALNITYHDLMYLEVQHSFPPGAISANLRSKDEEQAPTLPPRWTTLTWDGLTVAVTGVSRPGVSFLPSERYTFIDPSTALGEVLPELQEQADIVVVLAYELGRESREILRSHPSIDVWIEADAYSEPWEPFVEGSTVWVRSFEQTQRLGELRLAFADGTIRAAQDRKIDLDEQIPNRRDLARIASRAEP